MNEQGDNEFERMTMLAKKIIEAWRVREAQGSVAPDETPTQVYLAQAFLKYCQPSAPSMRWNPNTSSMEPHNHSDDLGMKK